MTSSHSTVHVESMGEIDQRTTVKFHSHRRTVNAGTAAVLTVHVPVLYSTGRVLYTQYSTALHTVRPYGAERGQLQYYNSGL